MIFRIRNMGTAKTVSEVKIMPLTKMEAENFTVFEKISIPFCRGLNVLVHRILSC